MSRALAPGARARADPADQQQGRDRVATLHPEQRALPTAELTDVAVYAYSVVVTDLDVSTLQDADAVEHWYRHRTTVDNIFRDAKIGGARRHLPSGYPQVNTPGCGVRCSRSASRAGCTSSPPPPGPGTELIGHGTRDGQAMIATLRHRPIRVPARLVRHAGALTLRLPPGPELFEAVLARIHALPATP